MTKIDFCLRRSTGCNKQLAHCLLIMKKELQRNTACRRRLFLLWSVLVILLTGIGLALSTTWIQQMTSDMKNACRSSSLCYTESRDKDSKRSTTNQLNRTPQKTKRPNILLITTDQQRFDAIRRVQDELQHYNNVTKIRTPNLDQLSRDGVFFRNAYCQSSVCGAARGTLRTGCTIERTGLQTNQIHMNYREFPFFQQRVENLTGIDEILSKHGYVSEHYGKWHLPDRLWKSIQFNNYDYKEEKFTFEDNILWLKYKSFNKLYEKRGLTHKIYGENMQKDPFSRHPYTPARLDSRYGMPKETELTEANGYKDWEVTQPNIIGESTLNHNYSISHFIVDSATKALRRLKKGKDPFFLTVSLHSPHPPMVAPSKYLKYYTQEKEKLFVAHSLYDNMQNSDYDHIARLEPKYHDYSIIQEWTSIYYALVEEIDDRVGVLLDKLGGDKKDTLVIFTSDHGEMLGAHGKREKNCFYEEANRVPLFLSYPGVIEAGTTVDDLTSHLDLVATILDYAGLSDADQSDGTSLRSRIEERSYNQHYDENVIVAEWDFREPRLDKPGKITGGLDAELAFMVRKDGYKLMMRKKAASKRMDMMFNLREDPFEMKNLLGSNAPSASVQTKSKAEHLRCLLLDWMNRMDGGPNRYYSDPMANFGEGQGDMEEIRLRQAWPAMEFWKSDFSIEMGHPVSNGTHYVRNEYLYVGRRTMGVGLLRRIRIVGEDADLFQLQIPGHESLKLVELQEKECLRVKITFATQNLKTEKRIYQATIKLRLQNESGDEDTEHLVQLRIEIKVH